MAPLPVLYDRDCGLCRVCMAAVLAWDRRRELRPVALQDAEADTLLAGMPHERRMASWHVVDGDAVHSAGAAFVPLLRRLPGGRPLAALAQRFPRTGERCYRAVADRRAPLGRALPKGIRRRADAVLARRSY